MFEHSVFTKDEILSKLEATLKMVEAPSDSTLFDVRDVVKELASPVVNRIIVERGITPQVALLTVKYGVSLLMVFFGEDLTRKILALESKNALFSAFIDFRGFHNRIVTALNSGSSVDMQNTILYTVVGNYVSNTWPSEFDQRLDILLRHLDLPVTFARDVFITARTRRNANKPIIH